MADKIYTKDEAFDLNRKGQEKILTDRKIPFKKTDKEMILVSKILDSNPNLNSGLGVEDNPEPKPVLAVDNTTKKEESKPVEAGKGLICEFCNIPMIKTGGGPSGTDYKCPKCMRGNTING